MPLHNTIVSKLSEVWVAMKVVHCWSLE